MATAPRTRKTASDNVVQIHVQRDQTERLIAQLSRFNDNAEKFVEHVGYFSEKFGNVSNDFASLKKFALKVLPWIVTAGAILVPRFQEFLDKLPPFPKS